MRIWDVSPAILCRQHLLGEHRELHGLWNILTQGKAGYSRHPETVRWRGKLAALYRRHEALVEEMDQRDYRHASPLEPSCHRLLHSDRVCRSGVATNRAATRQGLCLPCRPE
jgi:hypothetical protein